VEGARNRGEKDQFGSRWGRGAIEELGYLSLKENLERNAGRRGSSPLDEEEFSSSSCQEKGKKVGKRVSTRCALRSEKKRANRSEKIDIA